LVRQEKSFQKWAKPSANEADFVGRFQKNKVRRDRESKSKGMNMPAIADQVAAIEDDLQAALERVDSLMAENEALMKRLAAATADKHDLEAKNGEMQSVVDETRDLAHRLAHMALTTLRASRRQIGPQLDASNNVSGGDGATPGTAALTALLNAVSAAIAPEEKATYELTEQTGATAPPGPDLTGESIGLKRVSPGRGETATDRLRAHPLLDTAASMLRLRSQTTKLPDGMPMFLQADVPRENTAEHSGAGMRSADVRRRR
jgi:hypothetical protein